MIWYLCSCNFQAGGSVSSNGRLQGRLEVSRAFGDRQFKKVLSASILHSWHCSFMFSIYVWWQHLYICPCYVAGNETWFKEKYNAIACMQAYRSRDKLKRGNLNKFLQAKVWYILNKNQSWSSDWYNFQFSRC